MKRITIARELMEKLSALPLDQLVVGLFVDNMDTSQDEWLNPLAAFLSEAGFVTVGLIGPGAAGKANLDKADSVAYIASQDMPSLDRINAFVISDMDYDQDFPKNSKVLGLKHAFGLLNCASSLPWQAWNTAYLDAYLCPYKLSPETRELVRNLYSGFATRRLSSRSDRYYHIIPTGYPRLAVLRNNLKKLYCHEDSILYAPIQVNASPEMGGNRIEKYGKRIIGSLLDSFPDKNVIFRPYRPNLEDPVVRDLISEFSGNSRFILDDSPFKESSFARAFALVTDFSHIAQSFPCATERPSISFRPWERGKPLAAVPHGWIARTWQELIHALKTAMEGCGYAAGIDAICGKNVAPIDSSFQQIASAIRILCEGSEPPADWLTLERFAPEEKDDARFALKLLKESRETLPMLFSWALVNNNANSALFAAMALHHGRMYAPLTKMYTPLVKDRCAALGADLAACETYGDVPEDVIRKLYLDALKKFRGEGNAAGIDLVEAHLARL